MHRKYDHPYQPLTFAGKLYSEDVKSVADVAVVCTGIENGGSYTIALGPSTLGGGDGISTRYLGSSQKTEFKVR
ncbi:hypothetical protein D9M73_37250 [compost metagenome]